MRKLVSTLAFIAGLGLASPSLAYAANGWQTVNDDQFGFSMSVPDAMQLEGIKLGKWGGLHGKIEGAELWAVGRLHKHTPKQIRGFGIAATKIPAKHWLVVGKKKNKDGFDWFEVAVASNGKDVVWAKYGVGPKGSYLVVLKTTVAFSLHNGEALKAFGDSITVH